MYNFENVRYNVRKCKMKTPTNWVVCSWWLSTNWTRIFCLPRSCLGTSRRRLWRNDSANWRSTYKPCYITSAMCRLFSHCSSTSLDMWVHVISKYNCTVQLVTGHHKSKVSDQYLDMWGATPTCNVPGFPVPLLCTGPIWGADTVHSYPTAK